MIYLKCRKKKNLPNKNTIHIKNPPVAQIVKNLPAMCEAQV